MVYRKEWIKVRSVRIASGAGYAGDRVEPALKIIEEDGAEYIIFECLAERTIAIGQREKLKDPTRGYNDLLEYRMERILPLLKEHPIKIITNMGAANPLCAAKRVVEMAREYGLEELKIAAITGDDVLGNIDLYLNQKTMETGEALQKISSQIVSANAYIGGREITQALSEGADIIITGRVADPSLTTGPLMYEFQKSYEDFDFLGKTVVAGHLLECGGQVTGGYFADPGKKDVPELWDLGFPIITFSEDGTIEIEKLPGTGGLLNEDTVKEQLLYEIQDPENYLTPDVVADFSHLTVSAQPDGRVRVCGATGHPRTGLLKVSVGYEDGFIGTGEISYGARNCEARARLAAEIVCHRLDMLPFEILERRVDLIGCNSLYQGALPVAYDPVEVRMRVAIRTETEEQASMAAREVEALYTNGPAGGGGARGSVTKIISVVSVLIDEKLIRPQITWGGDLNEAV